MLSTFYPGHGQKWWLDQGPRQNRVVCPLKNSFLSLNRIIQLFAILCPPKISLSFS